MNENIFDSIPFQLVKIKLVLVCAPDPDCIFSRLVLFDCESNVLMAGMIIGLAIEIHPELVVFSF